MYISAVVDSLTVGWLPTASLEPDPQYFHKIFVAGYADSKPHRSVQWPQMLSPGRDEAVVLPHMHEKGSRTLQERLDLNRLDWMTAYSLTQPFAFAYSFVFSNCLVGFGSFS